MLGCVSGFHRRQGELHCDDVHVGRIAREAGTPVHVYSSALMAERFQALDAALADYPHRLHYAIKANSTLGVVRLMRELGASADANSGGEIEVALRAGFKPPDIVFTGVGKTRAELDRAVSLGVAAINVESPGEIDRIDAIAGERRTRARIAVRLNPDVDAGSHPHISTGLRATKFGVSLADAAGMIRDIAQRANLQVVGLHAHIGSQITTTKPLARTARAVATLARSLAADGIVLQHIDLGGGLGIPYEPGQAVLGVEEYVAAILPPVRETGLQLLLEPGRWITGPAGVLVTSVVDLKQGGARFVIVDAGMTELLRPALYGSYHVIEPVSPREGPSQIVDVVGPVCETSDTLGTKRELPPLQVGDLLAVMDTGAYAAVMASNYNRRPMAAEVMVDSHGWRRVRRRQTIDDMLRWDE